jgi:hypothetical protein
MMHKHTELMAVSSFPFQQGGPDIWAEEENFQISLLFFEQLSYLTTYGWQQDKYRALQHEIPISPNVSHISPFQFRQLEGS